MNEITEVKLTLLNEEWKIEVTKEFSPEYGGGSQVFTRSGGAQIHEALRRAAEMVTLTPTWNRDHKYVFNPENGLCAHCRQPCTARIHDWEPPTSHDYDAEGNPRRGVL